MKINYTKRKTEYVRTPEIREKIRKSLLGNTPWNKGKKRPPFSKEWKEKLRLSRMGNKSHTGEIHDEAYKKRMSKSCKGIKKYAGFGAKISRALIGKKKSIQHAKNVSKALTGNKKLMGENNWNWKGGITPLNLKVRSCLRYNEWRADVYTRDGYRCVKCGIAGNGKNLNADHIKRFSFIMEENNIRTFKEAIACKELWDIANGQILCVPCHRKTSTYSMSGRKQTAEHQRKLALARLKK